MTASGPAVIAIDGPAASGKSTTAAAVAREIGAVHLDSGSLYRALTVVALGVEPASAEGVIRAAEQRVLELRPAAGALVPFLDGQDAEPELRSSAVNARISELSAWPALRAWVNGRLRSAASGSRPLVVDGRDIGTDVFPGAPVKFFLIATPEARARRRLLQRGESPDAARIAQEAAALAERDRQDSTRAVAPLRPAADAVVLDTTALDFPEQVGEIVRVIRERLPGL